MPTIIIDKDGYHIVRTEGDVVTRTSVKLTDCAVSVPPNGFKKVLNIYVEPVSGQLVVIHE